MGLFIPLIGALLTSAAIVESAPHNVTASCTISKYNAADIESAQKQCSELTINGIEVPAGVTLDLTHMKTGAKLVFSGTITWGYKEWVGPLIKIAGSNIEVIGSSGHVLDGRGSLWWDGKGGNGGKKKPKFFSAKLKNSQIHKLNVKNTPVQTFSINQCENLIVQDVTIDNSAGDSKGGHNTDAFDVGRSTDVTIKHCKIYNQDDCLAVNSGKKIIFSDNFCSGGHGISIGSVGKRDDNVVENVKVLNCEITNSDNGVRIKTVYGATGTVRDITYQDITLSKIHKYGIVIEGDYENGSPTGKPTGGVPITDLTVKNVHGSVDKGGVNVYILVQNAKDWHFSNIDVKGGGKKKECKGIPSGAGISC